MRGVRLAIVVSALGYFVDIFDLVLFSILRVPSLVSLGLSGDANTKSGVLLLNLQLLGMILGGLMWGVLGDRRGRRTVLFGSILLYSLANAANAFVTSVPQYAVLRFLSGLGLAGELGAGLTLVSELMPTHKRGVGTTIVAAVGLSGAVVAGLVTQALLARFPVDGWRIAYGIGGSMGLVLLALRVGVLESGLFERSLLLRPKGSDEGPTPAAPDRQAESAQAYARGDLRMLLWPRERAGRFLRIIAVGTPIWFAGGVLFVFSPEIGTALGLPTPPTGASTILWSYVGVVIGDVASGALSQLLRSRRKVLFGFVTLLAVSISLLIAFGGRSLVVYYGLLMLIGFSTGYWVLFVTTASEQFGTNLRATVTTSAPNFVRGMAIPVSAVWFALKPSLGPLHAALAVGFACIAVALLALATMRESFDIDLDYMET